MSKAELEDIHIQGIATDVFNADTNYQVFEKIRKNWEELKKLEKSDFQLFHYLKECAKDRTIIYLGKLYDNRSNKYPTRCLEELFYLINLNRDLYLKHFLSDQKWKEFENKYSNIISNLDQSNNVTIDNYIELLEDYISKEKKDTNSPFYKLKLWRDKRNAHNERYDGEVSLLPEEVEFLLLIPKSILTFLNEFVSTGHHLIFEDSADAYFIERLLEKYSR